MRNIYQQAFHLLVRLDEEADRSEKMTSLISRVIREATALPTAGLTILDNQVDLSAEKHLEALRSEYQTKRAVNGKLFGRS